VRLLLSVPTGVLLDEPVTKVIAESPDGSFCLLPRHLDLATVLVPGLLTFVRPTARRPWWRSTTACW
jgi:F-type H+-transporting ATPase subunit epsilon